MKNYINLILVTFFLSPLFSEDLFIGSDRILFIDDQLIAEVGGDATIRLNHPTPQELVIKFNKPWEGNASGYFSIVDLGNKFLMYYKGRQLGPLTGNEKLEEVRAQHTTYCVLESNDGLNWSRVKVNETGTDYKYNNIIFESGELGDFEIDAESISVFLDENPSIPPNERLKALVLAKKPRWGLIILTSEDGICWKLQSDRIAISDGQFDSHNIAFWDNRIQMYRAYWRYFTGENSDEPFSGTRGIRTATSTDLYDWGKRSNLTYKDKYTEQLYTNNIQLYSRAPNYLLGFPTRYVELLNNNRINIDNRDRIIQKQIDEWPTYLTSLPEYNERVQRSLVSERFGTGITDTLFMFSKDGISFRTWSQAFIRPGPERDGTWNYGQNLMAWPLIETESKIDPNLRELSFFVLESYWTGNSNALRRFSLRLDGFVSINSNENGYLITKPFKFTGNTLSVNFSTSALGYVQISILDEDYNVINGFNEVNIELLYGDHTDKEVVFLDKEIENLVDKNIRLKFRMKDSDIYSFKFYNDN